MIYDLFREYQLKEVYILSQGPILLRGYLLIGRNFQYGSKNWNELGLAEGDVHNGPEWKRRSQVGRFFQRTQQLTNFAGMHGRLTVK